MAKKASATPTTTKFNARLVEFSTDLREFQGKKILEVSTVYENNDTWKQFTPTPKQYWIINQEGLEFSCAKAQRAFEKLPAEEKSFALYGNSGLIPSLQEAWKITMPLD